jgi:hydrogenase maturation factor
MRLADCISPDSCITCGDVAVAMTVAEPPDAVFLATCESESGAREIIDTSLLERVQVGDRVLVHAKVALANLGGARR